MMTIATWLFVTASIVVKHASALNEVTEQIADYFYYTPTEASLVPTKPTIRETVKSTPKQIAEVSKKNPARRHR